MEIDLSGKTAIVTGSTAGIGLAIVKGLAAAGAKKVVVNGRTEEAVQKAVAALWDRLPRHRGLRRRSRLGNGLRSPGARLPRCDVLVNNLGIYGLRDFFEIRTTNGRATSRSTSCPACGCHGRTFRHDGKTVGPRDLHLVGVGLNIPADMIHYSMTKTAMLAISRGLAKRAAGTGVTVNAILPGPTLTDGVVEMLKDQIAATGRPLEEVAAGFVIANRPSSIIRRPASVEEVANMVVYAASPQASATTGAALRVDGGVVDTIA